MGLFNRILRVGKSELNTAIDKLEDPIKMTEQGIRDLKKDLNTAMTSLAEVKSQAIRLRKQAEDNRRAAEDYEKKAMALLQKAQSGALDAAEADRLATEALARREDSAKRATEFKSGADEQDGMAQKLQSQVDQLKSTVGKYENDLITLRARARTAAATKKINKQLARVDSSGTLSMLEKMKERVETDESLAQAYGDLAGQSKSVDDEIDAALGGSTTADEKLAALKAKMGMAS